MTLPLPTPEALIALFDKHNFTPEGGTLYCKQHGGSSGCAVGVLGLEHGLISDVTPATAFAVVYQELSASYGVDIFNLAAGFDDGFGGRPNRDQMFLPQGASRDAYLLGLKVGRQCAITRKEPVHV